MTQLGRSRTLTETLGWSKRSRWPPRFLTVRAGGGAGADLDDVDLHRIRAGDLAFGLGEIHLYAAGTECGTRAGCIVWAVANAGADNDALPPAKGGAAVPGSRIGVAAQPKLHLAIPPEIRAWI